MRSRSRSPLAFLALAALVACRTSPAASKASLDDPVERARAALAQLVAEEWEVRLAEDPLLATSVGRHEGDARLPGRSAADRARRARSDRAFLERLARIPADALPPDDRITLEMLTQELEERLLDDALGAWQLPWNSDSGFHLELARLPADTPLTSVSAYEAYVARLREVPRYFGEQVGNLRAGLARGWTLPAAILDGFEAPIAAQVVDDPARSDFFAPFTRFPVGVPEAERARLAGAGRAAVAEAVVPAYRDLLRFFVDEYRPGARTTVGASELAGGRAYYEARVRHFTTLDVTPEEVHALGLREVARLEAEMTALAARAGFGADLPSAIAHLRTDPRYYARSPEELLARAARLAKLADAALPAWFGLLPRLPYGVAPVPDAIAPRYTGGRYVPPPRGSREAGTYWVNTYALDSRPLYVLPALTLHEAVPGHHLQMSLSAERDDLPDFRRAAYVDAFGEGWALYCEWLGIEMGMYRDDSEEFGRLTYEMWRACRLVVDTGLHALGWTRERALDYLAGHTALSLHECATEVDRYISWPGQALAYKMGELEIRDLRRRAEERLGREFDVRAFHDLVLSAGTVPLAILRGRVERELGL